MTTFPTGLMGYVVVGWGGLTGHLMIALPMALLLEGPRLLSWRASPLDRDTHRVADFSTLLFLLFLAQSFFSEEKLNPVLQMLRMVPIALFPLVLVVAWSDRPTLPISALFLSKRKRKTGTDVAPVKRVDLFYPFSGLVLLSGGVTHMPDGYFMVWAGIALVWIAWSRTPVEVMGRSSFGKRWGGRIAAALAVAVLAYGIQEGLATARSVIEKHLTDWFVSLVFEDHNASRQKTSMGEVGELKLSGQILFRVKQRTFPWQSTLLLKEGSYSLFLGTSWYAAKEKYTTVPTDLNSGGWRLRSPSSTVEGKPARLRHVTLYTDLSRDRGRLPLPDGTATIAPLPVEHLERNGLDAVRYRYPEGIARVDLHYDELLEDSLSPVPMDLQVPPEEEKVIAPIVTSLKLDSNAPEQAVRTIGRYFQKEFHYTTDLSKPAQGSQPVSSFLP
ncbi:MAG: hypothetical protein HQL50_12260 [Magnetococcales bacterium]|nr:hypothetical protein [Magnetococcales bacterium]